MGEPEGGTGPEAAAEASALYEGGPALAGQAPGGAAPRESVQVLRGRAEPALDLNMLLALDEPEQLMRELKRYADAFPNKRWTVVSRACQRALDAFEILHKAPDTPIAKEP